MTFRQNTIRHKIVACITMVAVAVFLPVRSFGVGVGDDLTITATELSGGRTQFDFTGDTTAKQNGTISGTPSAAGNPPFAGAGGDTVTLTISAGGSIKSTGLLQSVAGAWFLSIPGDLTFTSGNVVRGSGTFVSNTVNFSDFTPGSFFVSNADFDITYVVIPLPAAPAPATGTVAAKSDPIVLVANANAIRSADTGIAFTAASKAIVQTIHHTALGDLNDRLFKARASNAMTGGIVQNSTFRDRERGGSLANFLKMSGNQNVDYRVALGLAEGKEVEVVDTIASNELVASSPFALAGVPVSTAVTTVVTKAVVVDVDGSGKAPFDDKQVNFEEVNDTPYELFTEFDFGFYDQDRLSQRVRSFDIESYAATLGFEYDVNPNFRAGVALSQAWSDAELSSDLGGVEVDGQLATVYATAFHGDTWLDLLYSYGNFDHETDRNTLLGSRARGETESDSHSFSANAGHTFRMNSKVVTGPLLGVDYSKADVDGYTETGGGLGNLIFSDTSYESLIGRIGWSVSHTQDTGIFGQMTTQFRAGWAHEFNPDDRTYTAELVTSPFALVSGGSSRSIGGYTVEGGGAAPGQDWLEIGAGVRFDLNSSWNLRLDYEGQIARENAAGHFGTVRVGYAW